MIDEELQKELRGQSKRGRNERDVRSSGKRIKKEGTV
jgi:hypothetical protein